MKSATVIVPVYQGEAFLEKSLGSVFAQTYTNVELITINDGSRDMSLEVLKKLQTQCPPHVKMVVLDQDNRGICATRNRALDIATGDYIFFMDQDDFMKPDCISSLVQELEKQGADLVIGGYDLVDEQGKVLEEWTLNDNLPWCKYRISAPWGRVFKKSLIDAHGLRFMITKISEDFYFNLVYMSWCEKISTTSYRGYSWRFSSSSESHANMSVASPDRNPYVMMSRVLEDMHQPNRLEPEMLEYMFIKHVIWYLFFTAKGVSAEGLKSNYRTGFDWLEEHFPNFKKNRQVSFLSPKGESLKIRTIVWASLWLDRIHLFYPALRLYSKLI